MRICLLLSEIFAWGKYGGYGSMARVLAKGLKDRGLDVWIVVPMRRGQKERETLDGVPVLGYPGWTVLSRRVYDSVDADVYHSIEPTLATLGAVRARPFSKHIVTAVDPWSGPDWKVEFRYDLQLGVRRAMLYPLIFGFYNPALIRSAVRRSQAVYCQARYLQSKVQRLFQLVDPPGFLPNPVILPKNPPEKADHPTVCFLARWDPRKRPEIFFQLAERYPKVDFIAFGKSHDEGANARLRKEFGHLSNLRLVGFINPFENSLLSELLGSCWVMVNTSAREGLPASYVEAAAHRCAILSAIDADGFVSRGGYLVRRKKGSITAPDLGGIGVDLEDYAEGLEWLLSRDRWRALGIEGFRYVEQTHERELVLDRHLDVYKNLFESAS